MNTQKLNIPIVLGITGHRDLIEKDIPILKKKVKEIFLELKQKYQNSEIYLISALAEGADMLVAEVAYECEVKVSAVLPYEKQRYMKSFDNPENIKNFEELYKKAKSQKTLITDKNISSSDAYENLGIYIATHSNILIALWDGVESGKRGGTSEVVRYAKDFKVENEFDSLDGNAIYIIKTPRLSNPNIKDAYSLQKKYLGKCSAKSFAQMLKKIDETNLEISSFNSTKSSLIERFEEYFSKKAKKFQKIYERTLVVMLVLAFLAVVSMEVVHNFGANNFLYLYAFAVFLIFIIYYFAVKHSQVQNNYFYSRGIAEALRVQKYWLFVSNEPQRAGDYYLSDDMNDTVWIRNLLKNIYFLVTKKRVESDLECVEKEWIEGQIKYYKDRVNSREKTYERLEMLEKGLYIAGLLATIAMFYTFLVGHLSHLLLFLSGIFFASAAFIGEKYIVMKGYEEEIYNYERMYQVFIRAKEKLKRTKDTKKIENIIYDLGEKALEENSKWVILHSKHHIKPIIE